MNRIIKTIIICFFVGFLNGQDTILSKDEVMNIAYAEAEQEGKNVFLMFDASWCGWCKRMDKNMNNNACKNFFDDNYVTVHLAIKESKENKHLENPGAPDFYDSLKEGTSGIPFWVIFDSKGNVLDNSLDSNNNNIGSPVTKDEVQVFVSILKDTSKLNDKELSVITEVFWDKAYD